MTHFNLPNELDALLRGASIVRPRVVWYNLPNQLRAIKTQLLLVNEDLQDDNLASVLNSTPNANWFNYLFVANKLEVAINLIN